MSKITDLYDDLITRLTTVFPTHSRLTNPYNIESNNHMYMEKAYGLAFGPGVNSERSISCKISVQRNMTITLTRKWGGFSLEQDASVKSTIEKTIFEDQFLLIKEIENNFSLAGKILSAKFISDGGLEFPLVDNDEFVMIQTVVQVEYLETLTP